MLSLWKNTEEHALFPTDFFLKHSPLKVRNAALKAVSVRFKDVPYIVSCHKIILKNRNKGERKYQWYLENLQLSGCFSVVR
jgi:hypothetical protein